MALPIIVVGPDGVRATVTKNGQLVVGSVEFDETKFVNLGTANTAFNFFAPRTGKRFIITGAIIKADKEVDSSIPAEVVLYEGSSATTTTVDRDILEVALIELEGVVLLPMNIITAEGKFINAKTTDDDIFMTLMGYFIDIVK